MLTLSIYIFGIFIMTSCSNQFMTGNWSTVNLNTGGMNISDTIIFNRNGDYQLQMYSDNQLVDKLRGTYELDKKKNQLKIVIGDSVIIHQIKKLTDDTLIVATNVQGFKYDLILKKNTD